MVKNPPATAGDAREMWVQGLALVAQTVENLPAMWETWVRPLGRVDPLEKGMAPHSSILATHPLPKKGLKVIFWASLVAQRLKCLPAMQETWI